MNAYSFNITVYDLASIGAIFMTLTLALQLWFAKRASQAANRFLSLALGVVGLSLLSTIWVDLPFRCLFALGPLIFFYSRKITHPEYHFRPKDLLHFSPVLLEFGMQPLQQTYTLQILFSISAGIYLYMAHYQIAHFYRSRKFTEGDRYCYELGWLRNSLITFGVIWFLWIPLAALNYFIYDNKSATEVYSIMCFLSVAGTNWIATVTLLRPEIAATANVPSYLKPLLPDELKQKGIWLKKVVKSHRYFEDPELSLTSLADKLELTTHELSHIINTALKKSFNDFINEYRVNDATRKMKNPAYDHITLLGIAYESGFNSKTTFNRTFKQIAGKSPVEYKNEYKKERPSYNLEPQNRIATIDSKQQITPMWFREKSYRNYMFRSYFKIARRNLMRHKGYTAINVFGLSVGIAVCMMIFIIIQYQSSFDGFHAKQDRTYRVLTEHHPAGSADVSYGKDLPFPIPLGLKTAFPQIEQMAPVFASQNDQLFILDDNGKTEKVFKEQRGVFYTGPSFFKIFDFPLLAGSYQSLKDPNNVLLTKEIAEKYFGDWRTAIGKTIKLEMGGYMFEHGTDVLKVSGVLATIPPNTDFQLKVVVAYGTGFTGEYLAANTDWNSTTSDFGCYVLLPPNTSAANFNQQLSAYSRKVKSPDNNDSHIIQPLSDVHYDTQVGNYSGKTISRELINVLWLIAAFILLIACVNFINLSTAQAVNRAKEVGVRKVLGGSQSQLQVQFIVETFLIVAGAVILATGISLVAISPVNQLLDLSLSYHIFTNPIIILFLSVVTIVVTVLAGFYPSIVLSRFNPVNALKSKLTANPGSGLSLRRGLVVFQFIIAQGLIIGTLVIVKQMDYFMNQPLGFDKDAIVNVPFRVDSLRISKLDYLRKRLLSVNGVQSVTFNSNTPVEAVNDVWSDVKFNHATKASDFKAVTKFGDEEYVPTYKLKLVAGRNLKPSGYTQEFLVNESLVKSLGLKNPDDILNKEISIWDDRIKCPVVGVLKDFKDRSFHHNLAPLVISTNNTMYTQAGVKLATANMSTTMHSVKEVFEQTFPDFVYEYKFLDEKIAGFYKQEEQLSQLYKIFAAIAVFLSCLGLYGLASFMAVQRVKEVGIRKVLGATTGNIVYLFSKEFIVLITIAFAIATPIAWYFMNQWLQAYVYRINISLWLFVAGGLGALVIALITISFQALKAAMANPVKSLRSE